MTVREIYDLISNHYYLRNRTEAELITIFENAYRSVLAYRNEEIDLTSTITAKLSTNREFNTRLGIQVIDQKIAEKFPLLSLGERLLLYRIIQTKIYKWYPTAYEFDTNLQNIYKKLTLSSSLDLVFTKIKIASKGFIYSSNLVLSLFTPITVNKTLDYISNLGLILRKASGNIKALVYESIITPTLSLVPKTEQAINFINEIILNVRAVSSRQQDLQYTSLFDVSLRVVDEADYIRSFTYSSELTVRLTKE